MLRRIRFDEPLTGDPDPEERFRRFPSDFAVKGMFFTRLLDLAPPGLFEKRMPELVKPPILGRYLPFSDYHQVDYSRLACAVARAIHPDLSIFEALRRLARHDIATFAASTVGRTMLEFAGDAKSALLAAPKMYRVVLEGGVVHASELGPRRVELVYEDFYGWVECYPLGAIEAVATHYGERFDIDQEVESETAARYVITLR